jgi:hypothetical protein
MLMAGFARQVARSLPENDPNQEKLGIISEEAKRLENMLIQVRDFTRPQQLRQEKAQINDLILETTKLVQEKLDMDKIRVSLNLFPELPEAYFDQAQIKQVLLNLIKNAWEAIPGEGSISITQAWKRTGSWSPLKIQARVFPEISSRKFSIHSLPPKTREPAWGWQSFNGLFRITRGTSGWTANQAGDPGLFFTCLFSLRKLPSRAWAFMIWSCIFLKDTLNRPLIFISNFFQGGMYVPKQRRTQIKNNHSVS